MNKLELQQIQDFYEGTILEQIIRPLEINHIYKLVVPSEENPQGVSYRVKQRAISIFVQNKQWELLEDLIDLFSGEAIVEDTIDILPQQVDSTETAIPADSDSLSIVKKGRRKRN